MDEEAKQLLFEIRELIAVGNAQEADWLARSRQLQEESVGYNRKAWRMTLLLGLLLTPIIIVVALWIGFTFYSAIQRAATADEAVESQ